MNFARYAIIVLRSAVNRAILRRFGPSPAVITAVPNATKTETAIKYAVSIQGPLTKPIPRLADQALQIVPVGAIRAMLGQPLNIASSIRAS